MSQADAKIVWRDDLKQKTWIKSRKGGEEQHTMLRWLEVTVTGEDGLTHTAWALGSMENAAAVASGLSRAVSARGCRCDECQEREVLGHAQPQKATE